MSKRLLLSDPGVKIMGVLNITPDSFYPGSRMHSLDQALHRAQAMITAGADCLDIGGESTRPGAENISIQEECDRVLPIVEAINREFDICISIDTSKPKVMQAAVELGATLINDVNGLREDGAVAFAAQSGCQVCVMHMQGKPRTMQQNPSYENVIAQVKQFLQERVQSCLDGGIAKENIIVDPGFGFGKTVTHNLQLIKSIDDFASLGYPVLIGVSNKSTIGHIVDCPVETRLYGSIALSTIAIERGANIIRTHNVKSIVDAAKIVHAYQEA